jgi:uncharacterized protein YndB with AHSA1/START domain
MHVKIRFVAEGDGTVVTLEHRGWERCSVEQRAEFDGYDRGWEIVLAPFRDAAAA